MINEEKLIEDIWKHSNNITSEWETAGILNLINQQPKVGEWIPVSERLPEMGELVLCSLNPDNPTIIYLVVISRYDDSHHWHDGIITAWQPLPAPYDMRKEGVIRKMKNDCLKCEYLT